MKFMTETNRIEGIFTPMDNLRHMKNTHTQNVYQSLRHEWNYVDYLSGSLSVNYMSHVRKRSKWKALFNECWFCKNNMCSYIYQYIRLFPFYRPNFSQSCHTSTKLSSFVVSMYWMEFIFILGWHRSFIIFPLFFPIFFCVSSLGSDFSRETEKCEE